MQTKELEVRAREAELAAEKDANQLQFSKEALAAQERDRAHDRTCGRETKKDKLKFFGIVSLLVILLVSFALYLDKDAIASEIIKAVVFLAAGAAAGYGYGRRKEDKPGNDSA